MKLTLQGTELTRALYRVQGIADKKAPMPVLSHVLLDARDGQLKVSATDLDVGLSGVYEAQIHTPGAVAVPARQLYDVVKALPSGTLEFERQNNNWVTLDAGASHFKLVGMSADEFPELPSHADVTTFPVDAQALIKMIEQTIFCVSTDDNRHNLGGIYCESPASGVLRMVATDGHRLAFVERALDASLELPQGVIVPRKGFQELKRILGDVQGADVVQLGFSPNSGFLQVGGVAMTTRLVEGQFPDYQQVIPKDPSKQARIGRAAFGDALRRVSLLAQGGNHGIKLEFETGNLKLIAEDPELGQASEDLPIEYNSEDLTVGFNARYLQDVLNQVKNETLVFELSDDLSPGVIRPLEEEGFLAVVMPMRI